MEINNFDIIRSHLTFESNFDRYLIHIIKREKDQAGKSYGVNESNRLIKTFYLTSLEYLDKKIPVIKDLCIRNNARAYILPQVRHNPDCLKELLKIVVENLDNPTIKPDHLIRSSYAGCHKSRDKKWILDLDSDNMIEYKTKDQLETKNWSVDEVLSFVQDQLEHCGKKRTDAYVIPTKSGHCIITSPFDLQKAYNSCNMLFQGVHKNNGEDIHGWLIKDGMALLYYTDNQKSETTIDDHDNSYLLDYIKNYTKDMQEIVLSRMQEIKSGMINKIETDSSEIKCMYGKSSKTECEQYCNGYCTASVLCSYPAKYHICKFEKSGEMYKSCDEVHSS